MISIKTEAKVEDWYCVPENDKVKVVKEVVRVYRLSNPEQPQVYCRGEVAEAEPTVPGCSMPVDELFV